MTIPGRLRPAATACRCCHTAAAIPFSRAWPRCHYADDVTLLLPRHRYHTAAAMLMLPRQSYRAADTILLLACCCQLLPRPHCCCHTAAAPLPIHYPAPANATPTATVPADDTPAARVGQVLRVDPRRYSTPPYY